MHSGMLPQAQTMPRRWNKRLPLMWALYVFHMMNMLFAPATQPRRPVDESEDEDDEGDAGEVDMEPPQEPAEHLAL